MRPLNTGGPGASWGGEADTLSRLLSRVGALDQNGALAKELASFGVAFQHFTLQDAIDVAAYAIRATADTMRFQMRPQTVGGPIDALVVRPGEARWLQRKELQITGAGAARSRAAAGERWPLDALGRSMAWTFWRYHIRYLRGPSRGPRHERSGGGTPVTFGRVQSGAVTRRDWSIRACRLSGAAIRVRIGGHAARG